MYQQAQTMENTCSMKLFFMLWWEHSSCFCEERPPHISEHCVQQMSCFLLPSGFGFSFGERGREAVLRWAVRVINQMRRHGFKDAVAGWRMGGLAKLLFCFYTARFTDT